MCEKLLLVSTQAADLIEVIFLDNVARNYACMTDKSTMDFYSGRPFYIILANFGKVDVTILKHQNVSELASAPQEIVHIKYDRFS